MEIVCIRCHQTVLVENCYCPSCGLPQLQYAADVAQQSPPEPGSEPVRDAATVAWKPALRAALLLALPAGALSSERSPVGGLGLLWMAAAASLTVVVYIRNQRSAWITFGAGARIGLVAGLLGAWMAYGASAAALFVERFVLHQDSRIDAEYSQTFVAPFQQKIQQSLAGMGSADAAQAQTIFANMQAVILSPQGRAGMWAGSLAVSSLFLTLFAIAGGAMSARFMARSRRPEI
ncbi:MAG: hypothetical protein ABSB86_19880 [Bryobacteraceae bacterium]|jgi:hypothetical protein